jgi:hypothetical protein
MDILTSSFRSGEVLRCRSVSACLASTVLDVPVAPPPIAADWRREILSQLALEPGDIEAMPLARTRRRWPQLRRCIDLVAQWMIALGLPDVLGEASVALMASRGTRYHHDGARYGSKAFCNLFLSEASGAELHFPAAGQRIALERGTAVMFDTCQPHAIIKRSASGFAESDFAPEHMVPQVFLTWELPIEHEQVQRALGIRIDVPAVTSSQAGEEQVWRNGVPVRLCPKTGGWLGRA